MIIIPAVDIRNGYCVRLEKGKKDRETRYSEHPYKMARKWEKAGAKFLHVVDLDGAFMGEPHNLDAVREIIENVKIPVELGGGMRTMNAITQALSLGIKRVILGTKAANDPDFVKKALDRFGSDHIVMGIDAKNGRLSIEGWTGKTDLKAVDFALRMKDIGIDRVIYTDIDRDGMLEGPNIHQTTKFAHKTGLKVILSGGITTLKDVKKVALLESDGIEGMIIGKSLYEGHIRLKDALWEMGNMKHKRKKSLKKQMTL